jgi:hypothetical protein
MCLIREQLQLLYQQAICISLEQPGIFRFQKEAFFIHLMLCELRSEFFQQFHWCFFVSIENDIKD